MLAVGLSALAVGTIASAGTINVPADQPTIQAAITASVNGDEIIVASGTYNESLDFQSKAITIRSATGDPTTTIIDGGGSAHVVQVLLSSNARLEGLTITGGSATGSSTAAEGGGIRAFQSTLTVENCILKNNAGKLGGGAFLFSSDSTFTDCVFDNNGYNIGAGQGGGIHLTNGDHSLIGCAFTNNSVGTGGGGALYRGGTGGTVFIDDCSFIGNSASLGGAIRFFNTNPGVDIVNSTFDSNSATTSFGLLNAGQGGAIIGLSNGMSAVNCLFVNNVCTYFGGAISTSMNGTGAAGPFVTNCTLVNNDAEGSLSFPDPGKGGGICIGPSNGVVTVGNSILWGNTDEGGGDESAQIDFSNNTNGDIPAVTASIVDGLVASGDFDSGDNVGNIGADPMFTSAVGGDYTLAAGSPAIDAGDRRDVPASVTTDLSGSPRVADCNVEMGAYEVPGDADPDMDGIDSQFDNCPCTANSLQEDTDGNGIGDACDNIDTDGDGLLDATEIDIANGGGCPDPTNFDSDGDTLSDGEEVLVIGTSPCLVDTDGDGIADNLDDMPLDDGISDDLLVELIEDAADGVASLDLSGFTGPNDNANTGRRNSVASRLRNAANALDAGDEATALALLTGVLDRVDGESPPEDWMDDSTDTDMDGTSDRQELEDEIRILIDLILL